MQFYHRTLAPYGLVMHLNVTNSFSCSILNDTLSHSLFFLFICSAVWFVHWGLLAAPRGDAGSSNIICCDYVCVCVYAPVCVIAISSGLQGWPWTVQLTTIVNVNNRRREKQIKGATLQGIYFSTKRNLTVLWKQIGYCNFQNFQNN